VGQDAILPWQVENLPHVGTAATRTSKDSPMRDLLKPLLLISLALAVPIVPFLLMGDWFEPLGQAWIERAQESPAAVAGLTVGLLAIDVLLPVPSSVVSTMAGKVLGFWLGTLASWTGMTLGSVAAFAAARAFGRPVALWLSKAPDLDRADALAAQYGPLILVLARPVPVLAEASIVFFGTTRLAWRRFLLPLVLSNLGIAAVYALLGDRVQLPIALAASLALPLAAMLAARKWWTPTKG
jgi:uncharacterized membrane protein YdjX (TVP38/TMEM64 family)